MPKSHAGPKEKTSTFPLSLPSQIDANKKPWKVYSERAFRLLMTSFSSFMVVSEIGKSMSLTILFHFLRGPTIRYTLESYHIVPSWLVWSILLDELNFWHGNIHVSLCFDTSNIFSPWPWQPSSAAFPSCALLRLVDRVWEMCVANVLDWVCLPDPISRLLMSLGLWNNHFVCLEISNRWVVGKREVSKILAAVERWLAIPTTALLQVTTMTTNSYVFFHITLGCLFHHHDLVFFWSRAAIGIGYRGPRDIFLHELLLRLDSHKDIS